MVSIRKIQNQAPVLLYSIVEFWQAALIHVNVVDAVSPWELGSKQVDSGVTMETWVEHRGELVDDIIVGAPDIMGHNGTFVEF